jgi:hypothetical protein
MLVVFEGQPSRPLPTTVTLYLENDRTNIFVGHFNYPVGETLLTTLATFRAEKALGE